MFSVNFTEKRNARYFQIISVLCSHFFLTALAEKVTILPVSFQLSIFFPNCLISVYNNGVDANNSQDKRFEGQEQLLLICNIRKKEHVSVTFPPMCLPHS